MKSKDKTVTDLLWCIPEKNVTFHLFDKSTVQFSSNHWQEIERDFAAITSGFALKTHES